MMDRLFLREVWRHFNERKKFNSGTDPEQHFWNALSHKRSEKVYSDSGDISFEVDDERMVSSGGKPGNCLAITIERCNGIASRTTLRISERECLELAARIIDVVSKKP